MISRRAFQWWRPERPRLLVVDNQASHIEALYRTFRRTTQLFLANRPEQVLAMCEQHTPDVVIVNLNAAAPLNGLQVCRDLKAAEVSAIVLAVTEQAQPQQEVLALKAGASECLSSPLNPILIRTRVETQLLLKLQFEWLRDWVDDNPVAEALYEKRFDMQFNTEWRRSVRNGQALSLFRVSLDGFVELARRRGALAADDALSTLGGWLRQQLKRPADVVCRYGQGQFACLLPDTPWPQSLDLAWQLAQNARAVQLIPSDLTASWPLTISIGVATKTHESQGSMGGLLALADARLTEAQEAGGAQVKGVLMP